MVKADNVLSHQFTERTKDPNYIREAIHKIRSDPTSVGTPVAKTKVIAWVAAKNAPLRGIDSLGRIPKKEHLDHVLKHTPAPSHAMIAGTVRPPDRVGKPLPPTFIAAGTEVRAKDQHQNLRSLVDSIQDSEAKSDIEKTFFEPHSSPKEGERCGKQSTRYGFREKRCDSGSPAEPGWNSPEQNRYLERKPGVQCCNQ